MKKKIPRSAIWVLGILLVLAVFRDVIANGRPLYCRIGGKTFYPGLRVIFTDKDAPFKEPELERLRLQYNSLEVWKDPANFDAPPVYAPIPFSPGERSTKNTMAFSRPGAKHIGLSDRFVHYLGTDAAGRDVAATIVSGARIALLTGSLAMVVAYLIGLGLGMIAGYFGDDKLTVRKGQLLTTALGFPLAWFYGFTCRQYELATAEGITEISISISIFLLILLVFNRLGLLLKKLPWLGQKFIFPADMVIMRAAEIFHSVPKLILLIVLAEAFSGAGGNPIWLMIGLIGALAWPGVAKFIRAELLRIRSLDYISAARGIGMPEWRVVFRHAMPNAMRPVYIAFAFGAANAVLLEAYLTFMGFGSDSFRGISWGSLFINEASTANPLESWWVTVFPGLMIFLTALSLNSIGEAMSEK